jgi:hypothetical protein
LKELRCQAELLPSRNGFRKKTVLLAKTTKTEVVLLFGEVAVEVAEEDTKGIEVVLLNEVALTLPEETEIDREVVLPNEAVDLVPLE